MLTSTQVTLSPVINEFLNDYELYGFTDKNQMIYVALCRLKSDVEQYQLRESAELYAALYDEDGELQELTELAVEGWPE